MEFVKSWAKSVYVLAVLSSLVVVMAPRKMQKEIRFVLEIMVLLLLLTPLVTLFGKSPSFENTWTNTTDNLSRQNYLSLESFFRDETKRRILTISKTLGLTVDSVEVEVKGVFPNLTVSRLVVALNQPEDQESLENFRRSLQSYLGVPEESIVLEVK